MRAVERQAPARVAMKKIVSTTSRSISAPIPPTRRTSALCSSTRCQGPVAGGNEVAVGRLHEALLGGPEEHPLDGADHQRDAKPPLDVEGAPHVQLGGEVDAADHDHGEPGQDHPLADRVEGPVQRGQRARVGLGDRGEEDGVREGRPEGENDREDVDGEDQFEEGDGHEHAFDFDRTDIVPAFIFDNYADLFRSEVTLRLYASSIKFASIVWAVTLVLGFNVAYFLVFHVRTVLWQIALFLLCTVPFWTSNIIRMISWIPFLGRNGIFNQALIGLGRDPPAPGIPAVLRLRGDRRLCPPVHAVHGGADLQLDGAHRSQPARGGARRGRQPLPRRVRDRAAAVARRGIALGSIFVVTLVMGDFFVVKIMSGGQSASVVSALQNEVAALQYPPAAASAVIW